MKTRRKSLKIEIQINVTYVLKSHRTKFRHILLASSSLRNLRYRWIVVNAGRDIDASLPQFLKSLNLQNDSSEINTVISSCWFKDVRQSFHLSEVSLAGHELSILWIDVLMILHKDSIWLVPCYVQLRCYFILCAHSSVIK